MLLRGVGIREDIHILQIMPFMIVELLQVGTKNCRIIISTDIDIDPHRIATTGQCA